MHNNKKLNIYLRFITMSFLLFAGLVWGIFGITEYNIVSRFSRSIGFPKLSRVIYVMMGLSAVIFFFNFYKKDTFLPLLSKTIFPTKLIQPGFPLDYNRQVTLDAPKKALYVIYWASQGKEEIIDGLKWNKAYGDFSNSGAIRVQDNQVEIKFKDPAKYKVNSGKLLPPHVHYRWVKPNGILSKIHTLYL